MHVYHEAMRVCDQYGGRDQRHVYVVYGRRDQHCLCGMARALPDSSLVTNYTMVDMRDVYFT